MRLRIVEKCAARVIQFAGNERRPEIVPPVGVACQIALIIGTPSISECPRSNELDDVLLTAEPGVRFDVYMSASAKLSRRIVAART